MSNPICSKTYLTHGLFMLMSLMQSFFLHHLIKLASAFSLFHSQQILLFSIKQKMQVQ